MAPGAERGVLSKEARMPAARASRRAEAEGVAAGVARRLREARMVSSLLVLGVAAAAWAWLGLGFRV